MLQTIKPLNGVMNEKDNSPTGPDDLFEVRNHILHSVASPQWNQNLPGHFVCSIRPSSDRAHRIEAEKAKRKTAYRKTLESAKRLSANSMPITEAGNIRSKPVNDGANFGWRIEMKLARR
jgi:hypothetical protein